MSQDMAPPLQPRDKSSSILSIVIVCRCSRGSHRDIIYIKKHIYCPRNATIFTCIDHVSFDNSLHFGIIIVDLT